MNKYFSKPASWYPHGEDDPYEHPFDGTPRDVTVYDDGIGGPVFTGLLDPNGDPIYKKGNKIGFY